MSVPPHRPSDITAPAALPGSVQPADHAATLRDEFLHAACTLARSRSTWTPGPGHITEDLPWLKGSTAA